MKTAFKRRCAQAGQRFKVQMATLARSLDMELPGTMYEFGPHAVRGACGYGVFLMYGDHGVVMAAHYLGDEEATVREAYSSINGLHVDSSCLAAVRTGPQLNTGRHVSGATESVHTSRLHSLVDAFAAGTIDAASYMRQAAVIVDGCGHGALAA